MLNTRHDATEKRQFLARASCFAARPTTKGGASISPGLCRHDTFEGCLMQFAVDLNKASQRGRADESQSPGVCPDLASARLEASGVEVRCYASEGIASQDSFVDVPDHSSFSLVNHRHARCLAGTEAERYRATP
jgi:hypothetical protein